MSERRSDQRFEVCLDVKVEAATGRARVADLSESGCYIDTLFEPDPGQRVRLNLRLPSGEWLELVGEVAHSISGFGFGIRFVEMDATTRQRLSWLIANLHDTSEDLSRHSFA